MPTIDDEAWQARYDGIGSSQFPRHVAAAANDAAKSMRDMMRQSVREVVGREVKHKSGMSDFFGPTDRTVKAIEYQPMTLAGVGRVEDVSVPVYVKGVQGDVRNDQRAYMKYLFGDSENVRRPGDVGMDNDKILVPQNNPLLLTQKLNVNPYHNGGRQGPGILSAVKRRAAEQEGDMFTSPAERIAQAMSLSSRLGEAKKHLNLSPFELKQSLASVSHRAGIAAIDRHVTGNGRFDKATVADATRRYVKAKDSRVPWGVFGKADPKTGVGTYFARPHRIRDPAGGTHAIRRSNGKTGMMPNMINVASEYGEAGAGVGPRILFYGLRQATYRPSLQPHWDKAIEIATVQFERAMETEFAHALERKGSGRSY